MCEKQVPLAPDVIQNVSTRIEGVIFSAVADGLVTQDGSRQLYHRLMCALKNDDPESLTYEELTSHMRPKSAAIVSVPVRVTVVREASMLLTKMAETDGRTNFDRTRAPQIAAVLDAACEGHYSCGRCFDTGIVGTNTIHDAYCTCPAGDKAKGDIPPESGGCWYCHRTGGTMHFSMEFDTYLHIECLKAHLYATPMDLEALIIAREFASELEIDPKEIQDRIDFQS